MTESAAVLVAWLRFGQHWSVTANPSLYSHATETVRRAVEAADLRVLVLCLFHLTGDERWLSERFAPRRDVRLVADPSAGFSEEVQAEIRAAAMEAIVNGDLRKPMVPNPDSELFQRMMSFCLGENVPEEYVPMMRDDLGFSEEDAVWPPAADAAPETVETLIVGAGVSGMCLAIKLDQLGIPYTIVEKNDDVGGTWLENRYPGCGVDTPNHFYSYSFAPNPGWRHYFSPREELFSYLTECADRFDLRSRIRFNTEVINADWDDDHSVWRVTVKTHGEDGAAAVSEELTARVFVSATGHFNQPMSARFEGDQHFQGRIVHTAGWPDDLDLADKRVAVIGTGASSVQLVPTIANDVAHVSVFQRTPQWVRPTENYTAAVDPDAQWLFEHLPFYGRWYRFAQFWRYGDGLLRFLRRDPEWPYPDRAMNRINDRHRAEMTTHIETQLSSRPELLKECVPDYPPFGKRILLDNNWYQTLRRPDVELVTASIERFDDHGIVTADGRHRPFDVIVLATGFTVTTLAARLNITGRNGRRLADDWADDNPTAYLGMTVPDFPNFFVMYGPNTNLGHGGSGMWVAETQARYISKCLTAMASDRLKTLSVKPERRREYTERIDAEHAELIWTHPGTSTYYRNPHGQVRSPMPFRMVDYWHLTRHVDLDDYEVVD